MLEPDLENWILYLFIAAFTLVLIYLLWPYLVAAVVLYAILKAFISQPHHSNGRRCRRRCRRWSRW
jgi:cell division protein FtsW (lipid II flippase)